MSRRKQVLSRVVLAMGGLVFALMAAELLLRKQQARIQRSDRMDAGLFSYNARLGWAMNPGWEGQHTTYDYDVSYRTDRHGFRADVDCADNANLTLVVGDSFAFGYGVPDRETFASILNRRREDGACYRNLAVPGFATDQQLLLLEEELPRLKPRRVIVAICLVNDLFDNLRPFPLQGDHAKPYYEMEAGALVLRHQPVPKGVKTGRQRSEDLQSVILGGAGRSGLLNRLTGKSVLLSMGATRWMEGRLAEDRLAERCAPALALFDGLATEMQALCQHHGVDLVLAPIPGRSHSVRIGSASERYQEVLREGIVRCGRERGIPVIDIPSAFREIDVHERELLFFQHDGHLTAKGHERVAQLLQAK